MAKNDEIRCLALGETEGDEFTGVGSYTFMAYAQRNGTWPTSVTVTLSIQSLNPDESDVWIPLLTFTEAGVKEQPLCEPCRYKVTASAVGVQVYRLKKSGFVLGLRESS